MLFNSESFIGIAWSICSSKGCLLHLYAFQSKNNITFFCAHKHNYCEYYSIQNFENGNAVFQSNCIQSNLIESNRIQLNPQKNIHYLKYAFG